VREGNLRYREEILDGIEAAPGSIADLCQGKHMGKRLIQLEDAEWPRRLQLTPEGRAMFERMRVKSDVRSEAILQDLNAEQRHQLADMLGLVKRNLLAFDTSRT